MNPQIILGIVRHLLTLGGGAGLAISDNELMTAISAMMTIGSFAWSIFEKVRARRGITIDVH